MANYKITHTEVLVDWFYVEADSEEDAIIEFNRKVRNGEIDFSDLFVEDISNVATLDEA